MRRDIKDYTKEELTSENICKDGLKVGDTVSWVNSYGVNFENKVIGFNYDNEYNKEYKKYVHLDTDCYWFPHAEDKLKLKSK